MRIQPDELPKAALDLMSDDQRSYIDEFEFFKGTEVIEAFYGGQLLSVFDGNGWREPIEEVEEE